MVPQAAYTLESQLKRQNVCAVDTRAANITPGEVGTHSFNLSVLPHLRLKANYLSFSTHFPVIGQSSTAHEVSIDYIRG